MPIANTKKPALSITTGGGNWIELPTRADPIYQAAQGELCKLAHPQQACWRKKIKHHKGATRITQVQCYIYI